MNAAKYAEMAASAAGSLLLELNGLQGEISYELPPMKRRYDFRQEPLDNKLSLRAQMAR